MYLADTSALIELIKQTPSGKEIAKTTSGEPLGITSINVFELLAGQKDTEKEKTEIVLAQSDILPFDADAARISAILSKKLMKKGKETRELDLFIAAICIKHNATLITLDNDFKRIPNLNAVIIKP